MAFGNPLLILSASFALLALVHGFWPRHRHGMMGGDEGFFFFRADGKTPKPAPTPPAPVKTAPLNKPQNNQQPSGGDEDAKKCKPLAECLKDEDCGGGKAKCIGFGIGKCEVLFHLCTSKVLCSLNNCGGLTGACNETTKLCECDRAAKGAGFASYSDAFIKLPQKNCTEKEDCAGMPCKKGNCAC